MTEIKNVQIELQTPHVMNSIGERDSRNLFGNHIFINIRLLI